MSLAAFNANQIEYIAKKILEKSNIFSNGQNGMSQKFLETALASVKLEHDVCDDYAEDSKFSDLGDQVATRIANAYRTQFRAYIKEYQSQEPTPKPTKSLKPYFVTATKITGLAAVILGLLVQVSSQVLTPQQATNSTLEQATETSSQGYLLYTGILVGVFCLSALISKLRDAQQDKPLDVSSNQFKQLIIQRIALEAIQNATNKPSPSYRF